VASFVRLDTNPRIFTTPWESAEAWRFLDYLETSGGHGPSAWTVKVYALFKHLFLTRGPTGNHVPDALLAATAMRFDTVLFTADRGLAGFPGLEVRLAG
jgi:predicted nucleic acid-binding protein